MHIISDECAIFTENIIVTFTAAYILEKHLKKSHKWHIPVKLCIPLDATKLANHPFIYYDTI